MTVFPVIVRELRAESRHAFNYWLRVIGALALLLVMVMIWWERDIGIEQGARIFGKATFTNLLPSARRTVALRLPILW